MLLVGTDRQRHQRLPHRLCRRFPFFTRRVKDVDVPDHKLAGLVMLILPDHRLHLLHCGRFHLAVARFRANPTYGRNRRSPGSLFQLGVLGTIF